eukprot:Gb_06879 [translate_table: standard]
MASQNFDSMPCQGQSINTSAKAPMASQSTEIESMRCGTGCGFSDAASRAADAIERSASIKKLWIAMILCLFFVCLEVAGGIKANSLAILTDAAHLLSDVAGFAISLFAIWASGWEATPRQTFGFFRLEILGALVSIQIIWLVTGIIVYEAVDRILHKTSAVDGKLMFIVATFGLLVNLVMIFLLGHGHGHSHSHSHSHGHEHGHKDDHVHEHGHKDDHGHEHGHKHEHHNDHNHGKVGTGVSQDTMELTKPLLVGKLSGHDPLDHSHDAHESFSHRWRNVENKNSQGSTLKLDEDIETGMREGGQHKNINVQGAYLHVLGDLIQSIGVMIVGAVIWVKPEWRVIDLICTLFFSVVVLGTTIKMLRNILEVLMESTPREIDATRLEEGLRAIPGVLTVHELHIWAITVGKILLACHVRIESEANADLILQKVIEYCEMAYKISHVTVQIERE